MVTRVTEMQKRKMVSGYLNDDIFEVPPAVERIMNSPKRTRPNMPDGTAATTMNGGPGAS